MGRRRPRPVSLAISRIRSEMAPQGGLAAIQLAWPELVGEAVAAATSPSSERDGVLWVRCVDSVWAEELSMMGPVLIERLRERLNANAPVEIRFFVGDVTS